MHRRVVKQGFSLLEAMISIVVLGVLTVHSLPSLRAFIDKRAVEDHSEALRSALSLARTQAMQRDAEVTVCARRWAVSGESERCVPDSRDWSAGWLVFLDRGRRGDLGPDDQILLVHQSLPHHGRVMATLDTITFQRTGVSTSASARFTFLPPSTPAGSVTAPGQLLVCINKPGRARMVWGTSC